MPQCSPIDSLSLSWTGHSCFCAVCSCWAWCGLFYFFPSPNPACLWLGSSDGSPYMKIISSSESHSTLYFTFSTSTLPGVPAICAYNSSPSLLYNLLEASAWMGLSSLCLDSHNTVSRKPKMFSKLKNKMSFNRNTGGRRGTTSKGGKI